jgi:hygromycin-B 7''-O-kinase
MSNLIVRTYYQINAPDPVLTSAFILSVVRLWEPSAERLTGIDETGGEARVYFVDDELVVKVQRPQRLRSWTSLEKEVIFLRHLANAAPDLAVPRVVGYGRIDSVEYTVMTRLSGDAAVRTPIPAGARRPMLEAVGQSIRRIHSVPQEPLLASKFFPEEYTPEDLRETVPTELAAYAHRLAQSGAGWPFPFTVDRLIEEALARIPREGLGVALHSNPGPTHTFVDPSTGAFVGLIDFGDAYIGHPAHDLVRWPDPRDRDAVLAGYVASGDPGLHFWTFWPVAVVMADLLHMIRTPALRDMARQDLITTVSNW